MDSSNIEMGSRNNDPKHENNGTVNHSPLRSFSVDARYDLYKTQYSYGRQNSINNSKEYNALKDRKNIDSQDSKCYIDDHNGSTEINKEDKVKDILVSSTYHATNEIQLGSSCASQKLLDKDRNLTEGSKMTDHLCIEKGTQLLECGPSEKSTGHERQNRQNRVCMYRMAVFCLAMLFCSIGLLIVVFIKMSNPTISNDSVFNGTLDEEEALAISMAMSHHEVNVAGSFKINQTHLHYYHRVIWLKDEQSNIVPSPDDDCLRVPYAGKYLVFSRFTFNILPNAETLSITHFFKLRKSDGTLKDGGFKRKYVSVLENKLRTNNEVEINRELRKPSVFIEFFNLDANDQVCPNVSDPDLLYQSRMDNDVNIIRV